jgi:dUTP pyrophosphatase
MNKIPVKVLKLAHFRGDLPSYQTQFASGFDIRAQIAEPMTLAPGSRAMIPTGLSFEIPPGFEIQVRPRSGWAAKQGISILNTPGTVDADYRGEVKVIVVNLGAEAVEIKDQDRIAQMVLCPVWQASLELADDLAATERGAGGFGSTGLA